MDLKEKYGLSKNAYEIAEMANVYSTKNTSWYNVPHDYGNGKIFTGVEAHITTSICLSPGITAKEISIKLARTQSAVSQIISKLISKGMIVTQISPTDNREKLLYLTEKGNEFATALIKEGEKYFSVVLEEIINDMGVEALENFIEIFHRLTYHNNW